MQTFKNDTNYAKIAIKPNHVQFSHTFNRLLILSHNLFKTSLFDMHTISQMSVPLVIVAGQRLPTQCSRTLSSLSVSTAATTRVYITTSNSPYLNLVAYTTCGYISSMSISCGFKMSMN